MEGSPQPVESIRVSRSVKDNPSSASQGQSKSSLDIKETDSSLQQSIECEQKELNTCFDDNQSNDESEINICLQEDPKDPTSSVIPEGLTMETSDKITTKQLDNLNEDVPNDTDSTTAPETKCETNDTFQSGIIEEQEISSNSSEDNNNLDSVETCIYSEVNVNEEIDRSDKCNNDNVVTNSNANNKQHSEISNKDEITNQKNTQMMRCNMVSNVLIISDSVQKEPQQPNKEVIPIPTAPPEKKVKKVVRQKSKPAPPPTPPVKKINRDECDWDSLFDDNGDCLDPTLIEEASIYEFTIHQHKTTKLCTFLMLITFNFS